MNKIPFADISFRTGDVSINGISIADTNTSRFIDCQRYIVETGGIAECPRIKDFPGCTNFTEVQGTLKTASKVVALIDINFYLQGMQDYTQSPRPQNKVTKKLFK